MDRLNGVAIVFICTLLGLAIGSIFSMTLIDTEDKMVKCYDRDNNEILGQKCLDEGRIYDLGDTISVMVVFALFGGILTLLLEEF